MQILQESFLSLLLMGLIARAAVMASPRRGEPAARSLWWHSLSRAFAAAGLFVALGLVYFILYYRHGLWRWVPLLPVDEAGTNERAGELLGLVLAEIGVLAFLFKSLRRDWRRPEENELDPRPVGLLLLGGFAYALLLPLGVLFELAPHILDTLGGVLLHVLPAWIVADLDLIGWIGYAGLTCEGMYPRDVAAQGLNLLAGVTLLFWLFHSLWDRAMRRST